MRILSRRAKQIVAAASVLLAADLARAQTPPPAPISKLPVATLPLTGAELVPLVQSGTTSQTPASSFIVGPYVATGGNTLTSAVDRATFKGVSYDVRSDFGLACDGVTDDTAKVTAMVTAINASPYVAVRLQFPGTCLVHWTNWLLTKPTTFEGIAGGGLTVASGQTPSGVILTLGGAAAFHFRNFKLDLNSNQAAAVSGAIYFSPNTSVDFDHSSIINGALSPSSGSLYLLQCYGNSDVRIVHSEFSLVAPSNRYNEAINCGANSYPISHFDISHNLLTNAGIGIFAIGDDGHVDENSVNGWGYGGGITVENAVGGTDATTKNVTASHNVISNSMTSADASGTYLDGLELGFNGIEADGNVIYKTCGEGIVFYGKVTLKSNRVVDAGTCNHSDYANSGIVSEVPVGGATVGDVSYLEGNTVYDDGGGNTSYGYSDVSGTLNVSLGPNDFNGIKGSTNIVGGSDFTEPQTANSIVNPCVYFDRRKNRVAFASGFGPDQWVGSQSVGSEFFQSISEQFGLCGSSLHTVVSTPAAPSAGEIHNFHQDVVGAFTQGFAWTSGANATPRDLIFSFQFKSTISPLTQSCFVQNPTAVTSYVMPFTYTAPVGTLQTFSFRVPYDNYNQTPPSANSLPTSPGSIALIVGCDTGSGATYQTSTYRAWQSGHFTAAASATPFVTEPANAFVAYSSFRLLAAEADNGWTPRTYDDELRKVSLFYRTSFPLGTVPAQNAGATGQMCAGNPIANGQPSLTINFDPPMLSAPTITTFNPSAANANWRDTTTSSDVAASVPAASISQNGFTIQSGAPVATVNDLLCIHFTADGGI